MKAGLVSSKRAEEVALLLNSKWYENGMPRIKTLLTDNLSEYNGEAMRTFCNRQGIKHITSAAKNPHQNGAVERVHFIIDENINMLQEADPSISDEMALSQAVYAWNAMESKTGYSPFQLVYGIVDNNAGVLETLSPQAEVGNLPRLLE